MRASYAVPQIIESRELRPQHAADLAASAIDFVTAALAGVCSIDHEAAYRLGLRNGDSSLSGMCFHYWEPQSQRFSERFVRIKPDVQVEGRRYLQPVGERPRLYFVSGTSLSDLADISKAILLTEGEKKTLALERAAKIKDIAAVPIGIGGVWAWRFSSKELQPDGKMGKGKSRAIEDFDLIAWVGRKVYLFFDSDVRTNWKVAVAETALARELSLRRAEVYIVRFAETPR